MSKLEASGDMDLSTPGVRTVDIVLSDTEELEYIVKSLWINTDGEITGVSLYDAEPRTYTVFAGTPLPVTFRKIYETGTTASFVAFVK